MLWPVKDLSRLEALKSLLQTGAFLPFEIYGSLGMKSRVRFKFYWEKLEDQWSEEIP